MPISTGHAIQRPVVLSPSNLIDNWTPPYTLDVPSGYSPSSSFTRPNEIKTSPKMGLAKGNAYKRGLHNALLLTTASSQDERTNDEEREKERRETVEKIHYSLLLLSSMSLSSILLSLVSLVFFLMTSSPSGVAIIGGSRSASVSPSSSPLIFAPSVYPVAIEVIQEIINSLDVIVMVCSLASFFCSTFQIYFSLRQLKHSPNDVYTVIDYLRSNSFTRIVVYCFWFASVLAFIVVIVLTALLSPYRGSISKGVALSAGVSALVLCGIAILRSAWLFSRNTLITTRSIRKFDNYSTLV
ncbi:hypothetical protein PENTCL1PPCAC_22348 [Pristionchus entomophagus]|uniref:Transmembrane protein n=1 Tax=Pristionchus entomophagus TaxID=358040 RepID=A0AAV5U1W5_9BILA|nr:hypothetical protein PENTCL1PPCAC_22348 [Pristionchus entomophagus]